MQAHPENGAQFADASKNSDHELPGGSRLHGGAWVRKMTSRLVQVAGVNNDEVPSSIAITLPASAAVTTHDQTGQLENGPSAFGNATTNFKI